MIAGACHLQELVEGFPVSFRHEHIPHARDRAHRGLIARPSELLIRHDFGLPLLTELARG